MPLTSSTFISRHANRLPSTSNNQRTPPGGHASHDPHNIPPKRLRISMSDTVLLAAEQWPRVPGRSSIIKGASVRKTTKFSAVARRLKLLSQRPSDDSNDGRSVAEAVSSVLTMKTKSGFRRVAAHGPNLSDPASDHSCDISEIMTIPDKVDGSPGNADSSAPGNSQFGSDLAPLASQTFKEELYIRGYLKRPERRPSNVAPHESRFRSMFVNRKVFARVLGRQGHKVARCLRAGQATAEIPGNPDSDGHVPEQDPSTSIDCVTIQTTHVDGLESPGMDTNTSVSEVFDLHEFSYITAFTTPPSSPSFVLDAETFKKGVDLGDSKRAV